MNEFARSYLNWLIFRTASITSLITLAWIVAF